MKSVAQADWLSWPETRRLVAAFSDAGLRFVGGCVRDTLLNRKVREVDACTPLLPEAITALLDCMGIKAIPTGINHGTVTAVIEKKHFEITTLRRDVVHDGRHAEVAFTNDFAEDARRRDFTVNALYAAPDGTLEDYVGGLMDIEAKRLRFIGKAEERVQEDYLRILRYYRFGAELGWALNNVEAREACRTHAQGIERLSGERISLEMLKLLAAPFCDAALEAMEEDRILPYCLFTRATPKLLPLLQAEVALNLLPDSLRRLAFIVQSRAQLNALRERWKLSNSRYETLWLLLNSPLTLSNTSIEQKRLLRRVGKERFKDLAALSAAREGISSRYFAALGLAESWTPPPFPVSGEDLLALGFTPGKRLGDVLRRLEAQWEASEYALDKNQLLRFIEN